MSDTTTTAATNGAATAATATTENVAATESMAAIQTALRERACELLQNGEVSLVIGWEASRFADRTTPAFITRADEAERLVFNPYCVNTLAKYALREKASLSATGSATRSEAAGADKTAGTGGAGEGRVAVCVRGCDARAVNRMLADGQTDRSSLVLLGIPCPGMTDRATGRELMKCQNCTHRNPVTFDVLLGEEVAEREPDRFKVVRIFEAMDREKRQAYFDAAWARCIRCYACREVCPVCTCRECFVDQDRTGWQGKQANLEENRFYNLTRVFHIGDRCIECGECERACPMGLPLMLLNRKFTGDLATLFNAGEAGLTDTLDNALGRYDLADAEEFM
jgi:ferredoxin